MSRPSMIAKRLPPVTTGLNEIRYNFVVSSLASGTPGIMSEASNTTYPGKFFTTPSSTRRVSQTMKQRLNIVSPPRQYLVTD